MRKYWKYFKTLRWELWVLFFLSIAAIGIIDFWLIHIPELFPGGAKLGTLFSGLAFAFIAAFVFYFIVVHVKEVRDKENIREFLGYKSINIINHAKTLGRNLTKSSEIEMNDDYPSLDNLYEISKIIGPLNEAPQTYFFSSKNLKYHESIREHFESIKMDISSIYLIAPNFDTKLIKILTDIERNLHLNFFKGIAMMKFRTFGEHSANILSDFFRKVEMLEEYYKKNLKE